MQEITQISRTVWEDHIESVMCEVCKTRYKNLNWDGPTPFSESSFFNLLRETTIRYKVGVQYPSNHKVKEISYDICPRCFEVVLMPFLATFGAEPTIKEHD